MENLLVAGEFYYHPLTRKQKPPRRSVVWPDGEVTELEHEFKLEFKDALTPEAVVEYYYTSINLDPLMRKVQRDVGSVKYLVKHLGVDITLFSIDALINDYMNAEDRAGAAPQLVKAYDFAQWGKDQLGRVQQVAVQYGVDARAFSG